MRGNQAGRSGETRLEDWISYLLMVGVLVSLLLEAAGLIVYTLGHHPAGLSPDAAAFIHSRDFFSFLFHLASRGGAAGAGGTGVRLMVLGIAVLILTPYVRTIMSVVYFASTKNVKYLFITLFVLAVLTVSLMRH